MLWHDEVTPDHVPVVPTVAKPAADTAAPVAAETERAACSAI